MAKNTEVFTFSAPPALIQAIDAVVEEGERSRFIRSAIEARLRERERSRARRHATRKQPPSAEAQV